MTRETWKDIGALLAAFRIRRGEKRARVEARIRKRSLAHAADATAAKLAKRFDRVGALAPIEEGKFGKLQREEVLQIARAYGLADLMLHPLFLPVSPDSFVHASLDDFV